MFRRVFISRELPRDSSTFDVSFHEGLLSYKAFTNLFLFLGIISILICLFKFRTAFPWILSLCLLSIGLWCKFYVQKQIKTRTICFYEGKAIEAKVISHDKTFRDHSITLQFNTEDGVNRQKTIHYKTQEIWKTSPIGATVIGLSSGDKSFFGEEVATSIHFFHNQH